MMRGLAACALAIASVFGERTAAGAVAVTPPATIADVAWLAGCWISVTADRSVEEQWSQARGGTMLGLGRTVRGGETTEHEFVLIRVQDDRLAYEAHPGGQEPTVFLSTSIAGFKVIFENPAHDYPQVVGYELASPERLHAWIDGRSGGRSRLVEFFYRRTTCAS